MSPIRERLRVRGAVQGVGFRPFVYRLARRLELAGWVENTTDGVRIEVEGAEPSVEAFRGSLRADRPPLAFIESIERVSAPLDGGSSFEIRESDLAGVVSAAVSPDIATCAACLRELFDPRDRRFRYPFINCTDCGPRYTIVLGVPYDRERTTMARFRMCAACAAEYADPESRRFHAEPNACAGCGPRLALRDGAGEGLAAGEEALAGAVSAIRQGRIVAVKGVGGFHLVVDARDDGAVRELRRRKHREAKPLAVMVSSLDEARRVARIGPLDAELISSAEAPIVIVRRTGAAIAPSVAPGMPSLGLMLPYAPLHHLLMRALGHPVVATSGNSSDEPICIEEDEALARLGGIADVFLVHDRPIARPVDDSVVRVVAGRALMLRRARGYAPAAVPGVLACRDLLAVGAHVKNAVALSAGGRLILGPHVGDLETAPALAGFESTIATLRQLYAQKPEGIACDAHRDYASTQWAARQALPVVPVQHHYAHVLSCLADNGLTGDPEVTGVAWDGSGAGPDGTVWGGEVLRVGERGYERVAWLRPFPLPGGEKAVREPRRAALGVLWELHGETAFDGDDAVLRAFSANERAVLARMLATRLNCPRTSSAGRLFDAVAALVGLDPRVQFEGQAAMSLEAALEDVAPEGRYPFELRRSPAGVVLDWGLVIEGVRGDVALGLSAGRISRRFHDTLAEMIVAAARHAGTPRVALSGGCFQNKYLTERTVDRLRDEGFIPYWHRFLPPNDGGVAVGQWMAVLRDGERS